MEGSLDALEWKKILLLMEQYLPASVGKKRLSSLVPSSSYSEVLQRQEEMKRWFSIFQSAGGVRLSPSISEHLPIIEEFLTKRSLAEKHLFSLLQILKEILFIQKQIFSARLSFSSCWLSGEWEWMKKTHSFLKRIVNGEEGLSDAASPLLKELREKKRRVEEQLERSLNLWMEQNREEMQDTLLTLRSGRYVLPVRMDRFDPQKYIVHDISTTGRTYFAEPQEAVPLNNERQTLSALEKEEAERILRDISEKFWNQRLLWEKILNFLEDAGFFQACFEFSRAFACNFPLIIDSPSISLKHMWHPLLKERAVPVTLELEENVRALILSGPNAGGKTVTLKTVGLMMTMAACGLPIPADSTSSLFVPSLLFAQVGDEQSIERDWSAFTARLLHLQEALKSLEEMNPEERCYALFLLDEPSAGTHPEEGSVFAEALLGFLSQRSAKTLITTHSSMLKTAHLRLPGVQPASMTFDPETLQPTYQVQMGIPGPSLAFQLIRRLGFPAEICDSMEAGSASQDWEAILFSIHRMREEYQALQEKWSRLNEEIQQEKDRWEKKREAEMQKARKKIHQELEKIRKVLKEANALLDEAKRVSAGISVEYPSLQEKVKSLQNWIYGKLKETAVPIALKEVYIPVFQKKAVAFAEEPEGYIWVKVDGQEIRLRKEAARWDETPHQEAKISEVSSQVDVRGLRVEQAIQEIDRWLNRLFLSRAEGGKIIHGIGQGVLRNEIRRFLASHGLVKQYRKGSIEEGGEAVTFVELVESGM